MQMKMMLATMVMGAAMAISAAQAEEKALHVAVEGVGGDGRIAEKFALCKATADGKSGPGSNQRPEISWNAGPAGTKSYAIVVMDSDVPADFTDASKEGRILRNDAKRRNFFHWALADIPVDTLRMAGGDAAIAPAIGTAAKSDLGSYVPDAKNFGGPCPPWNDERIHRYHFMVMALDVEKLALPENPTASDVLSAGLSHVVARGEQVGSYTLNPLLMPHR